MIDVLTQNPKNPFESIVEVIPQHETDVIHIDKEKTSVRFKNDKIIVEYLKNVSGSIQLFDTSIPAKKLYEVKFPGDGHGSAYAVVNNDNADNFIFY